MICGIDIGKKGGISILNSAGDNAEMYPMPLTEESEIDILKLKNIISANDVSLIIFENLTPLHIASKKNNWSLAHQTGIILAICALMDIPYIRVAAKIWQQEMFKELPVIRQKNGQNDTKALSFIAAKKYFPLLKIQKSKDGLNDSLLLAEFGRRATNRLLTYGLS